MNELRTQRLRMRRWKPEDRVSFAEMNTDYRVSEFLLKITPEQSNILIDGIEAHFEEHGFGLWALELADSKEFIGFTGLNIPTFQSHFTPCVEIGWRLKFNSWGKGLATEAAQAALNVGFNQLNLSEIVAFTVPANVRSRRVMEKLGMTYSPSDSFDHPSVPNEHPLRPHVLYRLSRTSMQRSLIR